MKSKDQIFIFLITISVIFTIGLFIYGTSNPKLYVEKPSYRIGEVTEQQRAEAIAIALNNSDVRRLLKGWYIFSWDKVPGDDNEKLLKLLNDSWGIPWVKTAKIEKTDNNKTIKISTEKNYLTFKLNDNETNVSFKTDNGRTDNFIVKIENGTLNIYSGHEYYIEDVYHTIYYDACNQSEKVHKPRYDLTAVVINYIPNIGVRFFAAVDLGSKTVVDYSIAPNPGWTTPYCHP